MPEILYIFEVRIQEAHQFNHSIGIPLADFLVLKRQQVLNHFLNMPSVFTHYQVVPGSVIFHFVNTHSININYKVNKSNKVSLQKEKAFVKGPFYKGLVFPQVNEVWP